MGQQKHMGWYQKADPRIGTHGFRALDRSVRYLLINTELADLQLNYVAKF
jgi:hypothetical protein